MSRRIARGLTIFAISSVLAGGVGQLLADRGGCRKPARGCFCPAIFDPVTCDRGCVYSNACVAQCAGATNCVPQGGVPE